MGNSIQGTGSNEYGAKVFIIRGRRPPRSYKCTIFNVPANLVLTNGRNIQEMIMVEFDKSPRDLSSTPPFDLATQSATYLKTIGLKLRS